MVAKHNETIVSWMESTKIMHQRASQAVIRKRLDYFLRSQRCCGLDDAAGSTFLLGGEMPMPGLPVS
jgi:hypothetical protein